MRRRQQPMFQTRMKSIQDVKFKSRMSQQVELETKLASKQGDQRREVLRSTQLAEAGVEAEAKVRTKLLSCTTIMQKVSQFGCTIVGASTPQASSGLATQSAS